jgi:hypothetical protein
MVGWLFIVLRPVQEYFTDMETSPLPVEGFMLGAQGLGAGRDLYRATPAVTRGLGFPVSSEGPPHSVTSYDTQRHVEYLSLPEFLRVSYQSPLTTHKGMWRIYSNPDPHGVSDSMKVHAY